MSIDRSQTLIIAGKAHADPRTVRRLVAGEEVRGAVAERIRAALRDLGLQPAAPPASTDVEASP